MRRIRICCLAIVLFTLPESPLWAICSASPTYCESLPNLKDKGAALFLGTVTRVSLTEVTFNVTEPFLNVQRGNVDVEITSDLVVNGVPQGLFFRKGESWLIEARRDMKGSHWVTSNCLRNLREEQAGEELRDLRAFAAGKLPPGRIAVQVFNDLTHQYLSGVSLTLSGRTGSASGITDDRGGFLFEGVAPGVYEVSAQMPEWPAPIKSQSDLTQTWCAQMRLVRK